MAKKKDRKDPIDIGPEPKPRRPRHHQLTPRKPKKVKSPPVEGDPMLNPNVSPDGVASFADPAAWGDGPSQDYVNAEPTPAGRFAFNENAKKIQESLERAATGAASPLGVPFVARRTFTEPGYTPSVEPHAFAAVRPNTGRVDTSSIGDTGLFRAGGFVEHDFQKEWTNPKKYQTINMMLRAPEVAGMTYAVDQLLRRIEWRVKAANDSDSGKAAADFVNSALDDMELTWEEVVAQAISYQWYGFALLEILYKRRSGRTNDPTTNSKYDDGLVGWRRFSMRAQETLWRWEFDEWGNAVSVYQMLPNTGTEINIPIGKCWHIATTNRKSSPEGVSLLQSCWDAWYKMTYMQKFEAIGVQRDLAGFPMAFIPSSVMAGTDDADKAAYAAWQKAVTLIQQDEQGSLIMPSDTFPQSSNPMYRFELLRSAGPKSFNTHDIITRYALQVSQRLLADFLMTANAGSKGGSHAAHVDKTRVFTLAIQGTAFQLAAEFTRQCIRPLARLNGWVEEDMPSLEAGDIDAADLVEVATYLTALNTVGVPITPELQDFLYDLADFPTDTLDEMIAAQAAAAEKQKQIDADNAKAAQLAAQTAASATTPSADLPPGEVDKDAQNAAPGETGAPPANPPATPTPGGSS